MGTYIRPQTGPQQTLLAKAIAIASVAHREQYRDNGEPYIMHCLRVMSGVTDEFTKACAILHDVIEDTDQTEMSLILAGVPQDVVDIVKVLSRGKGEHYETFITRCSLSYIATLVKIQDLKDNLDFTQNYATELNDYELKRAAKYYRAMHFLQGKLDERFKDKSL